MKELSEVERAEREHDKELHLRVRSALKEAIKTSGHAHRYMILAWGYVRNFKYRRLERSHHIQKLEGVGSEGSYGYTKKEDGWYFEHNLPYLTFLHETLKAFLPGVTLEEVGRWLRDPTGAIPAPPPRPKKKLLPKSQELHGAV